MNGIAEKILIVDDDPMNALILEEIFGNKDYEILSAPSGKQAIELAKHYQPDLILLDIMLPDINGYEICSRLKKNQQLRYTKIILVSAKTLLKDRLKGYDAGADDFIIKPFDPDELLAKVKVFLKLKYVEEIEQAKDDILNVFSHETRTPLNSILGFAKILQKSDNMDSSDKENLNLIADNAENLLELTEKIVKLSKLKKEEIQFEKVECQIKKIADDVIKAEKHLPENQNALIKNSISSNLVLFFDKNLLYEAFKYIIENALKFSMKSSSDPLVEINSEINEENETILISIKDNGVGLLEKKTSNIVGEFSVGEIDKHGRGSGLSLAIVKYIMLLQGGSVNAQNNPDDTPGATFSLFFPMHLMKTN